MNMWLAAAPNSQVAHGALGCDVSLNDLCDRPPRALAEGEVIDLGGKRVRQISTPHVPHGWEAQVLFEETTGTLLCGDLFSQVGAGPALTTDDIVEPAMAAEGMFHATCAGAAHRRRRCGRSATSSRRRWRSCTARRSAATAARRCTTSPPLREADRCGLSGSRLVTRSPAHHGGSSRQTTCRSPRAMFHRLGAAQPQR